tara:strand:- start:279 stop:830 length:552 start_codon:yes stop_codon:yes gene_type:complete
MNKMFQGDDERMRGALPISQSAVQGLDRIGATNFVDPRLSQGFFGDLKSLFTGENAANINLSDLPGGGIATLPEFGQAGLDFTKDQGFRDYGRIIEDLVTAATPLKYGKMLGEKTLTGFKDFYNSLYPGRAEPNITSSEEENLDTLIDSIDEEADGELAKEILFGIEPTKMKNENKKKEFFFF